MTITRITPEKFLSDSNTKTDSINKSKKLSIYKFKTLDDYLEFCTSLNCNKNNTYSLLKKSTLYLYKSEYYLCLYGNLKDPNFFKSVYNSIIEFGSYISDSDLFERKLKEYGKVIHA